MFRTWWSCVTVKCGYLTSKFMGSLVSGRDWLRFGWWRVIFDWLSCDNSELHSRMVLVSGDRGFFRPADLWGSSGVPRIRRSGQRTGYIVFLMMNQMVVANQGVAPWRLVGTVLTQKSETTLVVAIALVAVQITGFGETSVAHSAGIFT